MSRTISLTARTHAEAERPEDVEVVLMQFEHDSLAVPVRVSSDATERLTTDPPAYGTRSTWNSDDPMIAVQYQFLPARFELPGDQEDAPAMIRVVLELFDATLIEQLRSINTRATAHVAQVLASDPDAVEFEFRNLQVISVEYGESLSIMASRKPIEDEVAAKDRFTKDRFPGLFR